MLYVIDSLQPAGAEWSLLAMSPHLLAAGVELEVVHFHHEPGLGPRFEALGIPVTMLSTPRGFPGRMRALHRLIRERQPELIHTTLFQADVAGRVAARSAGVPVVTSLVSTAYGPVQRAALNLPRWKMETARSLDAISARLATRFHAISGVVATEMGRKLRIPSDKIDVIPRGRDPDVLGTADPIRRARMRSELGISNDTPMVLVAARHEPPKALDVAVEAFALLNARLPDACLVVAGREGSATPNLHAAIDRSGVRDSVMLLGWRDDVPDLLAAADALLFTSRWEGLGSVLIEAMALTVPIVASDLPVLRELLVDGDSTDLAWFARVGDPSAFARQCFDALAEPGNRPQLARERFLLHYTAETVAEGISAFYARALSR